MRIDLIGNGAKAGALAPCTHTSKSGGVEGVENHLRSSFSKRIFVALPTAAPIAVEITEIMMISILAPLMTTCKSRREPLISECQLRECGLRIRGVPQPEKGWGNLTVTHSLIGFAPQVVLRRNLVFPNKKSSCIVRNAERFIVRNAESGLITVVLATLSVFYYGMRKKSSLLLGSVWSTLPNRSIIAPSTAATMAAVADP